MARAQSCSPTCVSLASGSRNFEYTATSADNYRMMRPFSLLVGITQICKPWIEGRESSIENPVLAIILPNLDLIHRWTIFLYDIFLQNPVTMQEQAIDTFALLKMLLQIVHITFLIALLHKHTLPSDVRKVFGGLWFMVGKRKNEDLLFGSHPQNPSSELASLRIGLCISCTHFPAALGHDAALTSLARSAGGKAALAGCVIRYIRSFAAYTREIKGQRSRTYEIQQGVSTAAGFSKTVEFLHDISYKDISLREYFFSRGLGILDPLGAGDSTDHSPTAGLKHRRDLLDQGFRYLLFALKHANDGEAVVAEAISCGILEIILRGAILPAERSLARARVRFGDFIFLYEFPVYFVYQKPPSNGQGTAENKRW
ncbi:hypothetical protein HYDPIDRAFT_44127 [Hydnomerulius pinastri MD-312]|uniref:Uncharacterized protein n=1 Tax=Hydnomerulius pinastri MD-312 TaxID=994086 RepID=A0A0C9V1X8_9AGAM|nr:hypothetical protein HYDPIDRAFT_44127 [Hydnomerulius pinastri MD-312]